MINHAHNFSVIKSKILEKEIFPADVVEFYQSLFDYQEKWTREFAGHGYFTPIKISGVPLISKDNFILPVMMQCSSTDSLKELMEIIMKFQSGLDFSLLHSGPDYIAQLDRSVKYFLSRDIDGLTLEARERNIDLEGYIFIIANWIKPMIAALYEALQKEGKIADLSQWGESTCPVCGYLPDMSKIVASKDNTRVLHCGLCEHEWSYKRISCTVCGNEDHETLGYYIYDDDPLYRFDFCAACRGYIKTIVVPAGQDDVRYDLAVENIASSFLDASAIEMGYQRP